MLNDKHRDYGKTKELSIDTLISGFESLEFVESAVLFGSRAMGQAHEKSDYDFALVLKNDPQERWGMEAKAWSAIHDLFGLDDCDYDIINFERASDALIQSIKEGYIILKGSANDISKLLR